MLQSNYFDNLNHYHTALEKIRLDYLKLLENDETTQKQKNEIWDASFVLQYMIASNKQYINRLTRLKNLNELNLDEKMRALLNEIYAKIGMTSLQDIHSFIAKGQQSSINKEIGIFFGELANINQRKSNFITIGTLTFFFVSGLAVAGLVASIAFVPPVLVVTLFILTLVTALGSLAVAKIGSSIASHYGALAANQKSLNNSKLDNKFFCCDSYKYIKNNSDDSKTRISIKQSGKEESVDNLQNKFNQQPNSQSSLIENSIFNHSIEQNVRKKYDLLVNQEAASPVAQCR